MVRVKSARRWFIVVMMLSAAAAAVYFDVERRRQAESGRPSAFGVQDNAIAGPEEVAKRFEDIGEFKRFCEKVEAKYRAMNARYRALQHRRRQRTRLLDEAGKLVTDEEIVEIVDFPGGKERHRTIEQKDLRTGKAIEGQSSLQKEIASRKTPMLVPFMLEARREEFDYRFVGVELFDSKLFVKIEVTPNDELNPVIDGTRFGKVAGVIWADAESGQPERFVGRWHKPTGFTHRYEMNYRYGPSENGEYQIRRADSDGSGGTFFIFRRYVAATEFDDYRPPEAK